MTQFELAKYIRAAIIQRSAEVIAYSSWTDQFAASQMREIPDWIKKSPSFQPIDPNEMTLDELTELGFKAWSEESKLWLIPLWLWPFLPDTVELGCIDGESRVFARDEIDNDSRFGCLAFGVVKE